MSGEIDLQRYIDWFVWARENLGRELDPTHAAAEAAYRSAEGGHEADAQAAARSAGLEPASLDSATMALAEWAAWAQSTGRFRPDQCVIVARHALAAVQASHDLDATIKDVLVVAQPRELAGSEPRPKSNRTGLIVAAVVVGLLVLGGATAAVISHIGSENGVSPLGGKPDISPTVQATLLNDGEADVYVQGYPASQTVYLFIDGGSRSAAYQTGGDGSLWVAIAFPIGAHTISACLDPQGLDCPASTFLSRDQ